MARKEIRVEELVPIKAWFKSTRRIKSLEMPDSIG